MVMATRRRFLGWLSGSSLLAMLAGVTSVQAGPPSYFLNVFSVAGFRYYDGPKLLSRIRPGERLRLKAQPENPHDPFAVEIYRGEQKIGYVPRSDNRHLSRLLRQGARLCCVVEEVSQETVSWHAVKVSVHLQRD